LHFPRDRSGSDDVTFVGCDGGLVRTHDFFVQSDSEYNKHLLNLQFYNEVKGGRFNASSRYAGLIAGGTQDNGNIYCDLHDGWRYWRPLDDGDGGNNCFIDTIGALLRTNNALEYGAKIRIAFWDETTRRFSSGARGDDSGDMVLVDGTNDGLQTPLFSAVLEPSWRRNGELMYACAAKGQDVYGLFAKQDGSNPHLTKLATLRNSVTSLCSFNGASITAGTMPSGIQRIDCATGQTAPEVLPAWLAGDSNKGVVRLQTTRDRAFALISSGRSGTLLRWTGTEWQVIGGGYETFAAHPGRGSRRIFAASETRVFASEDDGATWANASTGLIRFPVCSDLAIGPDSDGGRVLYLATYGNSVWQAQIEYAERKEPPDLPDLVADVVGGVIRDGGGLIRIGPKVYKVPPRSPLSGVVEALADWTAAKGLPHTEQIATQLNALRRIVQAASREIDRLQQSNE
jgi:hypothetical protein